MRAKIYLNVLLKHILNLFFESTTLLLQILMSKHGFFYIDKMSDILNNPFHESSLHMIENE